MGVKGLNRYICKNCDSQKCDFKQLAGKHILIDALIYVFQYSKEKYYLQKIHRMIETFKKYNIRATFVFDGKSPDSKREEIETRKQKQEEIRQRIDSLKDASSSSSSEDDGAKEPTEVANLLKKLEREVNYVTGSHIYWTKQMFEECGITYHIANGEADQLLYYYSTQPDVYAIATNDTDLIVYGCNKIIRNIDFDAETFQLVEKRVICDCMTKKSNIPIDIADIRMASSLAKNDYFHDSPYDFYDAISFVKTHKKTVGRKQPFVDWICSKNKTLSSEKLKTIYLNYTIRPNKVLENIQTYEPKESTDQTHLAFMLSIEF